MVAWAWWTGSVLSAVMAAAWAGLIYVDIDMDPPPEADTVATDGYIGLPGIPRYQKQVIASATAFLCFYVGTEVAYGGLVYTFAVEVRQLRHHFGPFSARFSAPPRPMRAVCYVLLGAHAERVLIVAWYPML